MATTTAASGKKKRSIDDSPLDDVKRAEIAPSSSDLRTLGNEEDDVQSSGAAERFGRFLFSGWTSMSIVTETTTSTSYVTAATSTELVDCLDNQWMFTMDICNNSMNVEDPFFMYTAPTTTGAPTTTAATTTTPTTTFP